MKTEVPIKIVSIHPNEDALQAMCHYFWGNRFNIPAHVEGGASKAVAPVTQVIRSSKAVFEPATGAVVP